jgi:hypothetical protein
VSRRATRAIRALTRMCGLVANTNYDWFDLLSRDRATDHGLDPSSASIARRRRGGK